MVLHRREGGLLKPQTGIASQTLSMTGAVGAAPRLPGSSVPAGDAAAFSLKVNRP
jgi:hypothetical protein